MTMVSSAPMAMTPGTSTSCTSLVKVMVSPTSSSAGTSDWSNWVSRVSSVQPAVVALGLVYYAAVPGTRARRAAG